MAGIEFADGQGKEFASYAEFQKWIGDMIAGQSGPAVAAANHSIDIVWLIISASLVFFMQVCKFLSNLVESPGKLVIQPQSTHYTRSQLTEAFCFRRDLHWLR